LTFSRFTTDLENQTNPFCVPSSFTASLHITPIDSTDLVADVISYIKDIVKKQVNLIVSPQKVLRRLFSLVWMVLYNLVDYVDEALASEALGFFDLIEADGNLKLTIESIDIWEDIVESRDANELKELIPSFVFERIITAGDIVQEITFENSKQKKGVAAVVGGSSAAGIS